GNPPVILVSWFLDFPPVSCVTPRTGAPMPSASACILVIFGASGDLAKRKLIPAINELAREKLLPEKFALVGYSRSPMTDDEYRKDCREAVQQFARSKPVDLALWDRIEKNTTYVQGD